MTPDDFFESLDGDYFDSIEELLSVMEAALADGRIRGFNFRLIETPSPARTWQRPYLKYVQPLTIPAGTGTLYTIEIPTA